MTPPRRHRRSIAIAALVLGILAFTAPPVYGGKPTRTVLGPEPWFIPAGFGCSFDVLENATPDHDTFLMITEFDDGRSLTHGHATDVTVTNLETGATFIHKARHNDTAWYDTASNEVVIDGAGQVLIQFYPGDQGPIGEVSEPGALLRFTGTYHLRVDLDTEVYTAFSYTGIVTDVCALIG